MKIKKFRKLSLYPIIMVFLSVFFMFGNAVGQIRNPLIYTGTDSWHLHNKPIHINDGTDIDDHDSDGIVDGAWLWIGSITGRHLLIDTNEMQAKRGTSIKPLYLQPYGGKLVLNNSRSDINHRFLFNSSGQLGIGIEKDEDFRDSGIGLWLRKKESHSWLKIESDDDTHTGLWLKRGRESTSYIILNTDDALAFYVGAGSSPDPRMLITQDGEVIIPGDLKVPVGEVSSKVLRIVGGGRDISEHFPVDNKTVIPKGAVVVIDPMNQGQLKMSTSSYDRKVAGIVSGAENLKPGLTLGPTIESGGGLNVALTGRVYTMVTAANGPIECGDLLTTSNIPGYAMKVTDYTKAQGAVIGKAMTSLNEGQGTVLVLVSLQ